MQAWLISHWSLFTGALSTVLALLGTWRFGPRAKTFLAGRFALEKENFYLRRENRILTSYIDRMEAVLVKAGYNVSELDSSDGLASKSAAIPPNRRTSRRRRGSRPVSKSLSGSGAPRTPRS